jgi:hypothetical protein
VVDHRGIVIFPAAYWSYEQRTASELMVIEGIGTLRWPRSPAKMKCQDERFAGNPLILAGRELIDRNKLHLQRVSESGINRKVGACEFPRFLKWDTVKGGIAEKRRLCRRGDCSSRSGWDG